MQQQRAAPLPSDKPREKSLIYCMTLASFWYVVLRSVPFSSSLKLQTLPAAPSLLLTASVHAA
jgi:hypothetical protein